MFVYKIEQEKSNISISIPNDKYTNQIVDDVLNIKYIDNYIYKAEKSNLNFEFDSEYNGLFQYFSIVYVDDFHYDLIKKDNNVSTEAMIIGKYSVMNAYTKKLKQ